jgi:hypothetical protein
MGDSILTVIISKSKEVLTRSVGTVVVPFQDGHSSCCVGGGPEVGHFLWH